MYEEAQRIAEEHPGDFEGVTDYVRHAIVELNLRLRAASRK
jgi:hypothetical protein